MSFNSQLKASTKPCANIISRILGYGAFPLTRHICALWVGLVSIRLTFCCTVWSPRQPDKVLTELLNDTGTATVMLHAVSGNVCLWNLRYCAWICQYFQCCVTAHNLSHTAFNIPQTHTNCPANEASCCFRALKFGLNKLISYSGTFFFRRAIVFVAHTVPYLFVSVLCGAHVCPSSCSRVY